MGFDLTDRGNQDRVVFVNFWNWRPTVELLRRAGLLDTATLEGLGEQFSATKVTKEQAHAIAAYIRRHVLPQLVQESRVLLGGEFTSEPDDGAFYHPEDENYAKNYGASCAWLETFAEFCESSDGFEFN